MGRTIAPKSLIHPEENVLRQVFGFRAIAGKPVANVEDAARMTAHKFLPGRTVALEALLDQLGILLQRIISLETRYGDQFAPKSCIGPTSACNYGTQTALEKFPVVPAPGRPTASEGILLGVSASTQGHLPVWPTGLPAPSRAFEPRASRRLGIYSVDTRGRRENTAREMGKQFGGAHSEAR